MIPYSPTSSVYHRNHRPHLRTFRPQAPILFEPNKSLTFGNKSQRESSSSLFITPVLVEVITASGEAQTRRSMPLHQSEYVKSARARRGRADGYSSSSGRLSSWDLRALTFCRYVRHCCDDLSCLVGLHRYPLLVHRRTACRDSPSSFPELSLVDLAVLDTITSPYLTETSKNSVLAACRQSTTRADVLPSHGRRWLINFRRARAPFI